MTVPSSAIERGRNDYGGLPLVDPRVANARTAAREQFVTTLIDMLTADDRFVAAWLTGSIARGGEDALSDVDLSLVVTDEAAVILCARPWQLAGYATPARAALFERFGQPAVIHENQHNAPPSGSWTCVIYKSLLTVDWSSYPVRRPRAHQKRACCSTKTASRSNRLLRFQHGRSGLSEPRNELPSFG